VRQLAKQRLQNKPASARDERILAITDWLLAATCAETSMRGHHSRLALLLRPAGFRDLEAFDLLSRGNVKLDERAIAWLKDQLGRLKRAKPGTSPVRRRHTISRVQIADVALTMLERHNVPPGLVDLLSDLLNVKEHRAALTNSYQFDNRFRRMADLDIQAFLRDEKILATRKMAETISVSTSTVHEWRNSEYYKGMIVFGGLFNEETRGMIADLMGEHLLYERIPDEMQRLKETLRRTLHTAGTLMVRGISLDQYYKSLRVNSPKVDS
jgi:hypothetical protein